MAAKLTPGGIWLREQRRALGLTADALGGALGVAGNTIRAVECGARNLAPQLRARAEAYIAKQLLLDPAGDRQLPPEDLVRVVAWVHPWTMTAALRLAKKHDVDVEQILGEWADRPREDEEWGLERAIVGALRSAINDHGPITADLIPSAAKRIVGNVVNARGPTVRG
jgi:transcriptional regulator with XRE-family HTH domain